MAAPQLEHHDLLLLRQRACRMYTAAVPACTGGESHSPVRTIIFAASNGTGSWYMCRYRTPPFALPGQPLPYTVGLSAQAQLTEQMPMYPQGCSVRLSHATTPRPVLQRRQDAPGFGAKEKRRRAHLSCDSTDRQSNSSCLAIIGGSRNCQTMSKGRDHLKSIRVSPANHGRTPPTWRPGWQ